MIKVGSNILGIMLECHTYYVGARSRSTSGDRFMLYGNSLIGFMVM